MRGFVSVRAVRPHLLMALLALFVLFSPLAAHAGTGFGPRIYNNGEQYGQGIFFAPYDVKVYAAPSEAAQVLQDFSWQHSDGSTLRVYSNTSGQPIDPMQLFFCFYPQLDVAMMAVIGDNDKGWVEVVYNQKTKETGWVKLWQDEKTPDAQAAAATPQLARMDRVDAPPHFGKYLTWIEFMKNNAKAHGIYWLSGVSEYNRSVRMMDKDDAPLLDVMAIRELKVRHLRGNWMLVEVLDFNRDTPIGWMRWRDNDGNLLVFPNFNGQHMPIMVTSF